MSDRTWVCISVAVKDEAALFKAMHFDLADKENFDHEEENGLLTITFNEMNWGGYDNMHELAKQNVSFMAQNGAGSSYGEALTVSRNGELVEVPCIEAEPACTVGRDMTRNRKTMRNIRRYYSLVKKVEAEFRKLKTTALDRHLEKSDMPQE
jgi:hypothetical protein